MEVDIDCSQAILDEIVKAVYRRHISVGYLNAGSLLAAGDFLQVRFKPVMLGGAGEGLSNGKRKESCLWG